MPNAGLADAFARTVERYTDRIAVTCAGHQLSYGELLRRATSVAREIAYGVAADRRVGLCATRSIEAIVGLLAIVQCGAAYVPIDPDYPSDRIGFIIRDSELTLLVVSPDALVRLTPSDIPTLVVPTAPIVDLAEQPDIVSAAAPSNAAYVIYTSGSTGRPKGVLVEYRNVLRLFETTRPILDYGEDDVWTLFHSISFDFSVWEIWGALLHGARLVIVPARTVRAPDAFRALLAQEQVTVVSQTPMAFRQLASSVLQRDTGLPSLRRIVFGGEKLQMSMLESWIARFGDERPWLVNMYGITETTVHVTWHRVRASEVSEGRSRIGVPLSDLEVHLLDDQLEAVPAGTPGWLFVSGAGVARGYLNQPAMTARRFVAHSRDGKATTIYDSGDRAYRLPTGELVYLGRGDAQLKVRGYRIEPAEIELCLAAHPAVLAAVVVAEDFGENLTGLVAYVQARLPDGVDGEGATRRALAAHVREQLPAHMHPAVYRMVASIPLTPHGKVDRRALIEGARVTP